MLNVEYYDGLGRQADGFYILNVCHRDQRLRPLAGYTL